VADPGDSEPAGGRTEAADPLAGLSGVRFLSLERSLIRTRESSATLSAWRLAAAADQGEGTILLLQGPAEGPLFRGEGVFLGWAQEKLAAAYAALRPSPADEAVALNQLG
jgi:hypothetical protein